MRATFGETTACNVLITEINDKHAINKNTTRSCIVYEVMNM